MIPGTCEQLAHLAKLRNIGISAHIDSGKTTLTERILFYTGRIKEIHEVKGTDGVGATMDSMDLEREKGITIQSAATHCEWDKHHINIIDTPGHVDFTIEVERALRVLDGAILILCSVSGVQSQSLTVDRQMKRYGVPRLCFINKLDRLGANPDRVIAQVRDKLKLNAAAVQIPMGLEDNLQGVVDVIEMKALYFEGDNGEKITKKEIPERYLEEAQTKRAELFERLAEVDDEFAEVYLEDGEITESLIHTTIRRVTIANKFAPVFMGSAKKNTGIQALLNGVLRYLPNPAQVKNTAIDCSEEKAGLPEAERKVEIHADNTKPFIGLAFKLEEGKYGQLTYMRVYQGTLKKGTSITNARTGDKLKVPRLVRMHANEMEDITEIGPGEICAVFGVDCASGDTFISSAKNKFTLETMFIPEPVVSKSVQLKDRAKENIFAKCLNKFQREDPTFKVTFDPEGNQTIISGMGELHLDIYVERMKREFDCEVIVGKPYVAYRETIQGRGEYNYTHKKQSGGAGQYAKVIGHIESMTEEEMAEHPDKFMFENRIIGNAITPSYITGCERGFRESVVKGPLIGCPVWGVKAILSDGATHPVDSSEMAFRFACEQGFRQAFEKSRPAILEPIMKVEIVVPEEFQGEVLGSINQRRGQVTNSERSAIDASWTIWAEVPLAEMFGYTTTLRSLTQGKGECSMEYFTHRVVTPDIQQKIIDEKSKESGNGGEAKAESGKKKK
ncbi:mitochondrial elongation factor EfG [Naegleria gruberi]|uniref:Elongation factor G, mitochondrial n=1 Tax=Naegleria gruberi TaxID=5762 RepID=D2VDQ7_NAEGR|nr:mitochondrial elongation factor EfG [Naegleria gruberi]EFC44939.1 mitochondrial elongation factor EfG [Naegleria gruberi]|eukprot:XP_002677683.1 mitochondrial elongation factor EfG [Naegleria gruberi strain NEG-M]